MKKFILSLVMVGFAVAVQAGDSKECTGNKTCTATKVTQTSCCSSMNVTKTSTCKGKQVVMSPKGAEQSVRLMASR